MSGDPPSPGDGRGADRLRRAWRWLAGSPALAPRNDTTTASPTAATDAGRPPSLSTDEVRARAFAAQLAQPAGPERDAVIDAVLRVLPGESAMFQEALAERMLHALSRPDEPPGTHAPWAPLAAALADALLDRCTWESAWRLLERSDAGAAVAVALLSRLPAPVASLGWDRLRHLAFSPHLLHRDAAVTAIRRDPRAVHNDLASALSLAEDADDVVVAALLEAVVDSDELGWTLPRLLLLLDSSRPAVRRAGIGLVHRGLAAEPAQWDIDVLLSRTASTPDADLRHAVIAWAAARGHGRALLAAAHGALFDPDGDDDGARAALAALGTIDGTEDVRRDVDAVLTAARSVGGPVRETAEHAAAQRANRLDVDQDVDHGQRSAP